ncbi:MAG: Hint domain-containing homing endonuclease [Ignavibacteria bacterium]|jgi:superfamily II DNA or RNA helicase
MQIIPRYYQEKAVRQGKWYFENYHKPFVLVLPTGCHTAGYPILTYDGKFINVEDIKKGDLLIGRDSTPRKVLMIISGKGKIYRITTIKGESFEVNENHILHLERTNTRTNRKQDYKEEELNVSVKDYLEFPKSKKHVYKLVKTGVQFHYVNEEGLFLNNTVLEPYYLGLWLGDGDSRNPSITNIDKEIIDYIKDFCEKNKLKFNYKADKRCSIAGTTKIPRKEKNFNICWHILNKYNLLLNKHIPRKYLCASKEERYSLLAGLIDSDGHLDKIKNCYEITFKDYILAKDVQRLCLSLGLYASFNEKNFIFRGKPYKAYRMSVSGFGQEKIPCKVERKKARPRLQIKNPLRFGFKVEYQREDYYYGFVLDGDNLYVDGNFFIQHNSGKSVCISELCHQLDEPILILQPTQEILEQNYQKLQNYGITDIGIYSASFKRKEVEKFTYATIGSIYRKPELFKHFKKVIIDECDLVNPKNIKGMYNKFFKAIDCKDICGLTATPYRMMQKFFKEGEDLFYTSSLQTITRIHPFFFKKIAYEISIKELMEKEYLAKLDYRYYKDFDTSKIKINTTGGDYDAEDLERFWDDERLKKMSKVIYDIDKECNYNLIFCSSIRQASAGCEMLRAMGLNAEYITSKHNNKDRERIINDFRNGKIKHLLNVNVMSCLSEDTELLTKDGWVNHNNISDNSLVAQYEEGDITFDKPLAIIRKDIKNESMIEINGRYMSFCVTKDHDMLIKKYKYSPYYYKTKATNIIDKKITVPVSGYAEPFILKVKQETLPNRGRFIATNKYNYKKKYTEEKAKLLAEELYNRKISLWYKETAELTLNDCMFIGFFLGDGSRYKVNAGEERFTLCQSLGTPNMIKWIERLLKECEIDYHKKDYPPQKIKINSKVTMSKGFRRYILCKGTGGHGQTKNGIYKYLPYLKKKGTKLFWGLNIAQYYSLMTGLWKADGVHKDNNVYNGGCIIGQYKELFDLLQAIGVCRGFKVTISEVKKREFNKKQLYNISLSNKQNYQITNDKAKLTEEKQITNVWCVNMPKGTIITRRNGRVVVLGNCGFDFPQLDSITLARPTISLRLYYQQCLDVHTEILTGRGFLKYNEITEFDKSASYNIETGEIKWENIEEIIERPLQKNEYICGATNNFLDFRVTNQHNLIYKSRRAKLYRKDKAENIFKYKDMIYLPVCGEEKARGSNLTDDEIRFLGWFLSDGNLNKKTKGITIVQSLVHKEYIKEIRRVLNSCGMKFGETRCKRKGDLAKYQDCIHFYISYGNPRGTEKDKRGWAYLEPYINKNMSNEYFRMTREQVKILISAIFLGDGFKKKTIDYNSKTISIITGNNKIYTDNLQALLITRGFRCNVSLSRNWYILYIKDVKHSTIPGYNVKNNVIKKKAINRVRFKNYGYKECMVWCIRNETGTIVTRRNGKVLIMGNCGRGIRPYTYKDGTQKKCKVIDLTNNVKKLGRIETIELAKEDGYKDIVKSEVGIITGKPLFTFKIKDEEKKQKYLENVNV